MVFVFLLFFNARFWTGLFVTLVEVLKKSRKKSVLGVIFIILPSTISQIVRDRRFLKHQYFVICFTTDLKQTVFPRSRDNVQQFVLKGFCISVCCIIQFLSKGGSNFFSGQKYKNNHFLADLPNMNRIFWNSGKWISRGILGV